MVPFQLVKPAQLQLPAAEHLPVYMHMLNTLHGLDQKIILTQKQPKAQDMELPQLLRNRWEEQNPSMQKVLIV